MTTVTSIFCFVTIMGFVVVVVVVSLAGHIFLYIFILFANLTSACLIKRVDSILCTKINVYYKKGTGTHFRTPRNRLITEFF